MPDVFASGIHMLKESLVKLQMTGMTELSVKCVAGISLIWNRKKIKRREMKYKSYY